MVDKASLIQCNIRDITERKRSEEILRDSEAHFKAIFNMASIGMAQADPITGQLLRVNQKMCEITGYSKDELLAMRIPEITYPEDRKQDSESFQNVVSGKSKNYQMEKRYIRKDETIVWVNVNMTVLRNAAGQPVLTIATIEDITERKRAQDALRESEERLNNVLEGSQLGFWDWNIETGEVIRNTQWAEMLGYKLDEIEFTFNQWVNIPHPDDKAAVRQSIQDHLEGRTLAHKIEYRMRTKDGQYKWILDQAKVTRRDPQGIPLRMSGTHTDITDRVNLQEQFAQAQKMESVGRLAGGVAHDFNNKLAVILGFAELALDKVNPSQPIHADLEEIRNAASQSANLTRQLLAFARKQTICPEVLDLNETIAGMLKMLRRLIGEDINLYWLPGKDLWEVMMDPSQIDQILANLCVNARDAIRGVGKITLETGNRIFDKDYCASHLGFFPGEYVVLNVSDNGCGMDKETQLHIFEPFFTTKEMGKGTGLGLSTVYGIIRQNNGHINVFSEPSQGTTFSIYLSRYIGKSVQTQKKDQSEPAAYRDKIILLVEDEPKVLDLTRMMLEKIGYTVLAAPTPGEAIRLAEAHTGCIHLVMTDVIMPGMNGRDLVRNLLAARPNLKSLFMSGYTANVIAHHGILDTGVNFIQKPFSIKKLAVMVRDVLDNTID